MALGDIFLQLVTNYAVALSDPLETIYNSVLQNFQWPSVWKNEYVTIIPKCLDPEDFGSCWNISCTNLFSKVLESCMLERSWAQVEPNMRKNQYGGQRGCGTEHFLSHLWTNVLENLKDSRGCCGLISLDFSKAFNRLDQAHIVLS